MRCGLETLSYRQLVLRASAIAGALADAGLEAGEMVAVSLERSAWRAAAFLGVLMAGATVKRARASTSMKRWRLGGSAGSTGR